MRGPWSLEVVRVGLEPRGVRVKPLLVGESNPYCSDTRYDLYPEPPGCSGDRLASILGLSHEEYMRGFLRRNLCRGPWSITQARARAEELRGRFDPETVFVLLGSKVSRAFVFKYEPFARFTNSGRTFVILPHPSGRCRAWNAVGSFGMARRLLSEFLPEHVDRVGG